MDSTQIEERAVTYLKQYLFESKMISCFLAEHDKEPCWDGHLYVYSDMLKKKQNLLGRIPVQVKGKVVERILPKKIKYPIDVNDLNAYRMDPTIYVVCQITEDGKEYRLFYRSLLPETIKNILKGKEGQKKVSVQLHEFPVNVADFEDCAKVFIGDRKRQQSFVDSKPFTLDDARREHITNFTFLAPNKGMNTFEVMSYLSSHPTFLYAKVDNAFGIEFPIADGPMSFVFQETVKEEVAIEGKVFYTQYFKEIKDGKVVITVGEFMTLTISKDNHTDAFRMDYKFESKTVSLKKRILEAEFIKAIFDSGYINIGDLRLEVPLDDVQYRNNNDKELQNWLELRCLFEKLHVEKDLNIRDLSEKDNDTLNVLVKTMLHGEPLGLKFTENVVVNQRIGNLNVLLWAYQIEDGRFMVGDFFDGYVKVMHTANNGQEVQVTPFAYLHEGNLWQECDNIPFEDLISYYEPLLKGGEQFIKLANLDLLQMLVAYDEIECQDPSKSQRLLRAAMQLCEWLILHNSNNVEDVVYEINRIQILKRQRELSEAENAYLAKVIASENVSAIIKAGACLLHESYDEFNYWFEKCSDTEKKELESFPVWRFMKTIS